MATKNPDAAGKCGKCHGLSHPGDIMVAQAPQHFGNMTASFTNSGYRASYVSSNYVGNCRNCHNPHDPTAAINVNRDWATSGHADVVARARTGYDFKTRGSYLPAKTTFQYYCVRCHTATGYVNFVTSGFQDVRPFAGPGYEVVQNLPGQPDAPSRDKTKELTACNVCHDNGAGRAYSWATRAVPPVSIYYNFSSASSSPTIKLNNKVTVYPDVTASNVCIPCHSGRGIGSMIYDAQNAGMDFSNGRSPGAHDRASATVLFRTGGYEFAGRSYDETTFLHNRIGVANERGTGNGGPCVTCHMKSSNSHVFMPVTLDDSRAVTGVVSRACRNCHDGSFQPSHTAASLQGKKAGYAAAMAMLNIIKAGKSTSSNWDTFSHGNGANTMGASFNYSLLLNEPGAYAHNSLYVKRLIYDSIDWISNASMDDDVATAITAATLPVSINNPFTKIAYTPAEIAALKTVAVEYLRGSGSGRP